MKKLLSQMPGVGMVTDLDMEVILELADLGRHETCCLLHTTGSHHATMNNYSGHDLPKPARVCWSISLLSGKGC